MKVNSLRLVVVILSTTLPVVMVTGEVFTMDWGPRTGNDYPFSKIQATTISPIDGRILQGGATKCSPVGARFECESSTTLKANIGENSSSYTDINMYVSCALDSQNQYDFRKGTDCTCEAHIHTVLVDGTSTPDKFCPCLICAEGFGNNPVSIDCTDWEDYYNTIDNSTSLGTNTTTNGTALESAEERVDSFIIDKCSSLDCGMQCNGTCRLDCASSEEGCDFCSNHPDNQPTAVPLTQNTNPDDPLTNFDGKAIDSEINSSGTSSFVLLPTLGNYFISFTIAYIGWICM